MFYNVPCLFTHDVGSDYYNYVLYYKIYYHIFPLFTQSY